MADVGGSSPSVPTKFPQHDAGEAGAGRRRASTRQEQSMGSEGESGLSRLVLSQEFVGSNPISPTNNRSVAQLD